jgi:hypothetical protein
MEACLQKMKVQTPEEMKSVVVHEVIPKEHATVKPVGELTKRHMGWHLAAWRHGQPEERTRGNCGSWKKLAAASRKMTCHAGVAWCKERGHLGPSVKQGQWKNQARDKTARGTWKGRTLGRR